MFALQVHRVPGRAGEAEEGAVPPRGRVPLQTARDGGARVHKARPHRVRGAGGGGRGQDRNAHLCPQQGVHRPRRPHWHPAQQQGRRHGQKGGRGQLKTPSILRKRQLRILKVLIS